MKLAGLTLSAIVIAVIVITATTVSRAATPIAPGDPAKGRLVFVREKCSVCHRVNGSGAATGPDLSAVGSRRTAAWLAKFLPNPTPIDPKKPSPIKMPPPNVKGQELDDLIAYLSTLKGK